MWKLIKKFFKYLIMFYIAIFVIIFVAFCSKDIEKKSKEILEKYQN